MFENIIGHTGITNQLKDEIRRGGFPSSVLFFGEPYSGKFTTALECARAISCSETGDWSCSCPSCRSHRLLESSNTLMLGLDKFTYEIGVCSDTLLRTKSKGSQFLYYRSVKKLLHQFDNVLWRNQEHKLKQVSSSLEKITGLLEKVSPDTTLPTEKQIAKITSDILSYVSKVAGQLKSDSIPIQQIRNITYWAHTTGESVKVVILNGVDRLAEGARNALLKILEEPPENVYFILISSRKESIIPTILSRVRTYEFKSRDEATQKDIIKRIFRAPDNDETLLRNYFSIKNGVDRSLLRKYAVEIVDFCSRKYTMDEIPSMETWIKTLSPDNVFVPFLEEMVLFFKDVLEKGTDFSDYPGYKQLSLWYPLVKNTLTAREVYNQSAALLLTSLIFSMKEAAL